jgi:hypothetical protein
MVVAMALAQATPVAASCAPPASIADNAARASAVVHGTVTDTGQGAFTLGIDQVFKGQVGTPLRIFVGPSRGAALTSVDYSAASGSNHMLYLIRGTDGELETNACIGSHPGPVTPDELAYFRVAISPAPASPDVLRVVVNGHPPSALEIVAVPAAIVLVLSLSVLILRRRQARQA